MPQAKSPTANAVLLVEDDPNDAFLLAAKLPQFQITTVETLADACTALSERTFSAVLLDLGLPDATGKEALDAIVAAAPKTAVVVLTGGADEQMALGAVQAGAQDYLIKDQANSDALVRAVRYSIERKAQRGELEQLNAKLQQVNHDLHRTLEARKTFVANASHDLRNPLAAISASISAMRQAGPLNLDQTMFMEACVNNTLRLDNLIKELLDLAHADAGTADLDLVLVTAAQVAREAVATVAGGARAHNIDLQEHLPKHLPVMLCDGKKLTEAFTNLLANAIKYSEPGKRVWLRAELLTDQRVEVCVTDEGMGIEPEDVPHIFEPFHRGSRHIKGIPGSGLGLAIVKEFVEAHGGEVLVESMVGRGSTFRVRLPLWHEDDAAMLRVLESVRLARRSLTDLSIYSVQPQHPSADLDPLLSQLRQTIVTDVLRHEDKVVHRLRQHDLILIMPDAPKKVAPKILRRLLPVLQARRTPMHIGLAVYPEDGETAQALLDAAAAHTVYKDHL